MEQLTKNQAVATSQEAVQNQNEPQDRKSGSAGMPRPISYAVFCLKKKKISRSASRELRSHGVAAPVSLLINEGTNVTSKDQYKGDASVADAKETAIST